MSARAVDCEKALVSCGVTLHHMRKLIHKAEGTNFVPRHMVATMPGASLAVKAFLKGMSDAQDLVRTESAPYLAQWQERYRLPIGGILRGVLIPSATSGPANIDIHGNIVAVQVFDWFVGQKRTLEFTLEDTRLRYGESEVLFHQQPDAIAAALDKPMKALIRERFLEPGTLQEASGPAVPIVKVRVGIRPEDRDDYFVRTHFKLN